MRAQVTDVCGWVPVPRVGPRPSRSRVGVLLFTLYFILSFSISECRHGSRQYKLILCERSSCPSLHAGQLTTGRHRQHAGETSSGSALQIGQDGRTLVLPSHVRMHSS